MKDFSYQNDKGELRRLTDDDKLIVKKDGGEIIVEHPELDSVTGYLRYGTGKNEYLNLQKIISMQGGETIVKEIRKWFKDRDADYECPQCHAGLDEPQAVSCFKKFSCECGYVAFVGGLEREIDVAYAESEDGFIPAGYYKQRVGGDRCETGDGKPAERPIKR